MYNKELKHKKGEFIYSPSVTAQGHWLSSQLANSSKKKNDNHKDLDRLTMKWNYWVCLQSLFSVQFSEYYSGAVQHISYSCSAAWGSNNKESKIKVQTHDKIRNYSTNNNNLVSSHDKQQWSTFIMLLIKQQWVCTDSQKTKKSNGKNLVEYKICPSKFSILILNQKKHIQSWHPKPSLYYSLCYLSFSFLSLPQVLATQLNCWHFQHHKSEMKNQLIACRMFLQLWFCTLNGLWTSSQTQSARCCNFKHPTFKHVQMKPEISTHFICHSLCSTLEMIKWSK